MVEKMSLLSPSVKTHQSSRQTDALRIPSRPHDRTQACGLRISTLDRICRSALLRKLRHISHGQLNVCERAQHNAYGSPAGKDLTATIQVNDCRFYRHCIAGGSLGAAESYMRGYWDCDDLVSLMRVMAHNRDALEVLGAGLAKLSAPVQWLWRLKNRNSRAGSRRNITAHYDLSNEFFAEFLDESMTYSGGLFEYPDASLRDASLAKYDRLCRLVNLNERDHLLEIGTGWGGFACYAASQYGARITTTTISQAQFEYANRRVAALGLADRVTVLKQDYRDLQGKYDKLVSIEMIEAVGHEFLGTYFSQCQRLLKPGGLFSLQAITIPDQRYDSYRKSVDFIQRYIFPGGCLPSLGAIVKASAQNSDFQVAEISDFAEHYAETLTRWRDNFHRNLDKIQRLGMSEHFLRGWHYYFCYCEGAFREQMIGLAQILFRKPQGR